MDDLSNKLRTADRAELVELLRQRSGEIGPRAVRQLLRNPFLDVEVIEDLLSNSELRRFYEVRQQIAAHPRTPQARAVGLVAGLYWRDLMRIGSDSRVKPAVRRAADQRLIERFGQLAAGERVLLARDAGPGLLPRLLEDQEARVVAAALDNPRLTEPMVIALAGSLVAAPGMLRMLAEHSRWGPRHEVRLTLCLNPATPDELAVSLVSSLSKRDRQRVARDIRVPEPVRQRATLLSEC